jgi:hypothetical protein
MKKDILNLLGDNHPDPIRFDAVCSLSNVYGLYTYSNDVYVFVDGMDIPFDKFSKDEKAEIHKAVLSKKWIVDNTMQ